jgi:hypothetical protein
MPDFDQNLQSIIKRTNDSMLSVRVTAPEKVQAQNFSGGNPNGFQSGRSQKTEESLADKLKRASKESSKVNAPFVTNKELDDNRRYTGYNPLLESNEDFASYGQSGAEQALNGVLKGANIAATTVVGGFAMLGGAAKSVVTGRLADIWDNPMMQALDEYNQEVDQNYLPNYYSNKETNAKWYEKNNWMTTNFLFDKVVKNSGFAVGAMISGNIANGVLGMAGASIGRAAMAGATAAESAQAFKVFAPLLKSTARAFSQAKNIEVAAVLENEIKTIADVATRTSEIAKLAKLRNTITKNSDYAKRTVIAAYSSGGEAGFEALQTSNEFRKDLIQTYKNNNGGSEPQGKDLADINLKADKVGKTSFLGNMALLSATEYLQLPKLLGSSYSAQRQAANDVVETAGKYAAKAPKTKFGRITNKVGRVAGYAFDPKEMGQEIGQYALQVGTDNYYKKAFETKNADVWTDGFLYGFTGINEKGESVGALNSKEGIEGGIIGGLTGGVMQSFGKNGKIKQDKIKKSNTEEFVESLNTVPTFRDAFKDKLNAVNRGIVIQQQHQQAVLNNDRLEATDLNADAMHNYLAPRIKYGRFDMVMEDIADIRQESMTPEGMASLKSQGLANMNDTLQTFHKKLDKLTFTAKNILEISKSIDMRYSGAVLTDANDEPILDLNGNQQRKFSPVVIDKMIYAASKITDYDLRIPELNNLLVGKVDNVQEIVDDSLSSNTPIEVAKAFELLEKSNDINKEDTIELLYDTIELAARRALFVNEYNDLKGNPQNYTQTGQTNTVTPNGKNKRTTVPQYTPGYSITSRQKFKSDTRTHEQLEKQYGVGEQNKRDVLEKILTSPFATTMEKELAAKYIEFVPRDAKIILGDRSLSSAGVSEFHTGLNTAVSSINYESSSEDYEGGTAPVEFVILHEIGHDLTIYGYENDAQFKKEVDELFAFSKEHFKNDPEKYAKAGLIKEGTFYAFKNVYEFMTEVMSNRDFQRYLDTIPYKNTQRTTWDTFIDNLKTFFSRLFKRNTSDTMLDEAVAIMTNNIERLHKTSKEANKALDAAEKELLKLKAQLEAENLKLQKGFGKNPTVLTSTVVIPKDDSMQKSVDILFKSSTSESEKWQTQPAPAHVQRSREFLNNANNSPNRADMRVVLVTQNSEKSLGVEGLTALSYGKEDASQATDVNVGLVMQVYVTQQKLKRTRKPYTYFVDKNGEVMRDSAGKPIKLGEKVDMNQVVFQTMPTTKLTNSSGVARFFGKQEDAEAEQRNYTAFRKELFKQDNTSHTINTFEISRGIPNENIVNGVKETNHVGGILISEDKITTQQGLVVIPTTGSMVHKGQILKFPDGVPVLQNGDNLVYLNNRKFNAKEATSLYHVIANLGKDILEQSSTGKPIRFTRRYIDFIQNVLYKKSKTANGANQINFNSDDMTMTIGPLKVRLTDLQFKQKEIVTQLQDAFSSVNNETLTKKFSEKFEELVFDGTELQTIVWPNYQTYLLASKYPDGTARSINDTPLNTPIAAPTAERPNVFQQKYSTVEDLEFPIILAPKKASVPVFPVKPGTVTLGGFVIDGVTKNMYQFAAGLVPFTATINAANEIEVIVETNDVVKATAADKNIVNNVLTPALKAAGVFDPLMTDENIVAQFSGIKIAAFLQEELKKQPAPPIQPAPIILKTHVIDGIRINTYTFAVGDMPFTAELNAAKEIEVLVNSNPTSLLVANDANMMTNVVISTLTKAGQYDPTNTPEQSVLKFAALKISIDLQKEYDAINKPPAPAPVAPVPPVQPPTTPPARGKFGGFKGGPAFRKKGVVSGVERISEEELELFKEWHAENVPNIPYEVLERIITTNNGEKAWGVFENGVAKFVKGGLRATEYHEIFEGIYKGMLSNEEQQALLDEFKETEGTFLDRETNKRINYSDATDLQAKERIADDFSDFRKGKLPVRSLKELVRNFFANIVKFFKSFVIAPSLKEKLFEAINTGKFKERSLVIPVEDNFAYYRAAEGLTEEQTHDFVQDMTAYAAGILYSENNKTLLFSPELITSKDVFDKIKGYYSVTYNENGESKMDLLGEIAWKELQIKTKDQLRTLGVTFSQQDTLVLNEESTNKNDYAKETFSPDWKSGSTGAIKFSLATLLISKALNQTNSKSFKIPERVLSEEIGGYKLLNFNKAFATVLDKLSNTSSMDSFVNKLKKLAEKDSNYVSLFVRAGGSLTDKNIPFENFNFSDWRYFIQLNQVFSKQKPDALIQYIKGTTTFTAPANLFTAIRDTQREWSENIKTLSTNKESLITVNKAAKVYRVKSFLSKVEQMPNDNFEVTVPNGTKTIFKTVEEAKTFATENDIKIKSARDMISFLDRLGVTFPINIYLKLDKKQKDAFAKATSAIFKYLGTNNDIMSIRKETLGINGPMTSLAQLYNEVTNPNQDSTFYGVNKQRVGAFSENNTVSVLENEFNEAETLEDLIDSRPELNDLFSKNSQVLKKGGLFFNLDGTRTTLQLKVKYIQGTDDNGVGKSDSRLTVGDRFSQEINQNLNGDYYVLIPADGSTEWMMNLGNTILFKDIEKASDSKAKKGINPVYETFFGYLFDDVALALDSDNRIHLKNINGKEKELRFFKDILLEEDLKTINEMIADGSTLEQIERVIDIKRRSIKTAIDAYIENTVNETLEILRDNNVVMEVSEGEYNYLALDDNFAKKENIDRGAMSEKTLMDILRFANTNYIINNIEYHKVLFGDPYQFAVKKDGLDETKRIKSFLSPRRTTFDTPEFNTFLNQTMNTVDGIELLENEPGSHQYKSHTDTVTLTDNIIAGSLANVISDFAEVDESDGFSLIMDNTYKEVKLKNGQWSEEAEAFHQWQMAYTRKNIKSFEYTKDARGVALEKHDTALTSTPSPAHKIEVLKPIVSGHKHNSQQMELVLDKYSQMPMYYSMVEGTNMEKFYIKMFAEKKGYAVVNSGRKVGATKTHSLYNKDASFNDDVFNNNEKVSWKSYGIQVETSSSGQKTQTRGSQLTKMASMDLFSNGVATSEAAAKEYIRNNEILKAMHENAYSELLISFGIVDQGDRYELTDGQALSSTLLQELLRRNVSDNVKESAELDEFNNFKIPFEASPSYVQIRNVLYSKINKALISPSMNGGPHVQVPVTMLEKLGTNRSLIEKTADGWVKITAEEYKTLSEERKKKVMLSDDTLKFYTKEDPYCELLLPHWFKKQIGGRFSNDNELLDYLNKTEEGRSILKGIAFRIPTQSLSSAETFRVKGFLPQYMGSTVVVPSEITVKSGSDFDIDKLNMYLKSIYIGKNGEIKLVKLLETEAKTKEFFANVFQKELERNLFNKSELLEAVDIFAQELDDPKNLLEKYRNVLHVLNTEDEADSYVNYNNAVSKADRLMDKIEELSDVDYQETLKTKYVKDMYKKALENEYYESLEKLITMPENFERLIAPIDDAGLKAVSQKLEELRGVDEQGIKNKILSRNYLTSLRHSFVMGKRWVGVVAVNITALSLKQKSKTHINPANFYKVSQKDQNILGDGSILLNHNTVNINGQEFVSLSGSKTADGKQDISNRLSGYGTAVVDIAKGDFITKIIQSDLVIGTFMFLENIGVGTQTALFMNQPIITEYLKSLDANNVKTLFNENQILSMKQKFPVTSIASPSEDLSEEALTNNIIKYYKDGVVDFTLYDDNATQQLIFDEFLKYAKMAEYNFKFTQASNYDTTQYLSGDSYSRKKWKTEEAERTNIISSVREFMDNTFVGDLNRFINSSMNSMSAIFKLEEPALKAITDKVLRPYGENDFLSADNFDIIANKIKAAFLDFVIQTKTDIGSEMGPLLLPGDNSLTNKLLYMKDNYGFMQLIEDLKVTSSDRIDGAQTIKLNVNIKDAYSENLYTGMMRELRDFNDETRDFYTDLVIVSMLQGTYQTSVSLKNIIPIEDYSRLVAPVITGLKASYETHAFSEGFFERNNFTDDKIMPSLIPKFFLTSEVPVGEITTKFGDHYADIFSYYSKMFPSIAPLSLKSTGRQVLLLSEKYNSFDIKNNFVKIPRVVTDKKTGESLDMVTGETITKMDYGMRLSKGDRSLFDVYGYKKVMIPGTNEPLTTYSEKVGTQYVYKLINLFGDGNRAFEYKLNLDPSPFDNGTMKVEQELNDSALTEYYQGIAEIKFNPILQTDFKIKFQPDNVKKILDGTKTTTIRGYNEFKSIGIFTGNPQTVLIGNKQFIVSNRGLITVKEAGGREAMESSENFENNLPKFVQTENWLSGKGKMYVYDITPLQTETVKETEKVEETSVVKQKAIKQKIVDKNQLNLFQKENESWTEEDNNDSCVPF